MTERRKDSHNFFRACAANLSKNLHRRDKFIFQECEFLPPIDDDGLFCKLLGVTSII
jgi:hypothetical protein